MEHYHQWAQIESERFTVVGFLQPGDRVLIKLKDGIGDGAGIEITATDFEEMFRLMASFRTAVGVER